MILKIHQLLLCYGVNGRSKQVSCIELLMTLKFQYKKKIGTSVAGSVVV